MDQFNWGSVVIAAIGIISAWLAGRQARKAAQSSADASMANVRAQAETEAYNRARAMDIQTIQRQDEDILDLVEQIKELKADNKSLRKRVAVLEGSTSHGQ